MSNTNSIPKYFKGIAVSAVIWNVLGAFSFFFHSFMPAEAIAKLPEAEQLLYQNIPIWKSVAFFIATIGGLLGSILLLLKKKGSVPVLILSFIGVIVSFYYDFFKTNLLELYGNESVIFPLLVTIIGAFLVWYAKKLERKNLLS